MTNQAIISVISKLKELGAAQVDFSEGLICSVQFNDQPNGPKISPEDFKKAQEQLDEEAALWSTNG